MPCKFFYIFRVDKAGSKIIPAERVLLIEAKQRIEFGIFGMNTQLFDRVALERFSRNKPYPVNPDSGNAFGNTYRYVFDKRVENIIAHNRLAGFIYAAAYRKIYVSYGCSGDDVAE